MARIPIVGIEKYRALIRRYTPRSTAMRSSAASVNSA